MITISTTSKALADPAQAIMSHEVLHNPNLNGATFQVISGDFDSIDGADELQGAILYNLIFRAEP
jgi:hypothetical protein